jgi:hypothetical protein
MFFVIINYDISYKKNYVGINPQLNLFLLFSRNLLHLKAEDKFPIAFTSGMFYQ